MGIINEFIGQYGMTIIYTILTAIAGAVATLIKKKYDEWANGKIKKETVQTVVYAVQQLYTDLDGSEKEGKSC